MPPTDDTPLHGHRSLKKTGYPARPNISTRSCKAAILVSRQSLVPMITPTEDAASGEIPGLQPTDQTA